MSEINKGKLSLNMESQMLLKSSKHGASDIMLFIIIGIIIIAAFIIVPKILKNRPKKEVNEQKSNSSVPYVGVYHKGMDGARKAVEASNERNSLIK